MNAIATATYLPLEPANGDKIKLKRIPRNTDRPKVETGENPLKERLPKERMVVRADSAMARTVTALPRPSLKNRE